MHPQKSNLRLFVRFCLSAIPGIIAYLVTFYYLVEKWHVWYIYSSIIAFHVNCILNFLIRKFWAFHDKDLHVLPMQLMKYIIFDVLIVGLSCAILHTLVEYAHLKYLTAQIISALIVCVPSFLISRWIFRQRPKTR